MDGSRRDTRREMYESAKTKRRSLYVKQNKAYQMLLATLIIAFVLVTAVVLSHTILPTSSVWRDNVLIRMIYETREAMRPDN